MIDIYVLLCIAACFLIVSFCKTDLWRRLNPFSKIPKVIWELNYEGGLDDTQVSASARASNDEAENNAKSVCWGFETQINDIIKATTLCVPLIELFKRHFIEFNDVHERQPHMLTFMKMSGCCAIGIKADYKGTEARVWDVAAETFICHMDVEFVKLTLSVSRGGEVGLYFNEAAAQTNIANIRKALNTLQGVETIIDLLVVSATTALSDLAIIVQHDNDGKIFIGSFEEVVIGMAHKDVYGIYRGADHFLTGFNGCGVSCSNSFFDPLAFGQAVLEGDFTRRELELADLHGYFEFEIGSTTYSEEVIEVYVNCNEERTLIASTGHRAPFDVPEAFEVLSLSEFLFYYHQLGLLLKGLFIKKHPELLMKAHADIWG